MKRRLENGHYKITSNEDGKEVSLPTIFEHNGQWVQIHGQTRPLAEYIDGDYTFTRLVPVTPEVLEAIDWIMGFATQPPRVPPLQKSLQMQRIVRAWLDSIKSE